MAKDLLVNYMAITAFNLFCLVFGFRYQLNRKKNKVDDPPNRKPNTFSAQNLLTSLSNGSNNDDFKEDPSMRSLSKSLVGGNMNICKTRVLNFMQHDRIVQGAVYHINHEYLF